MTNPRAFARSVQSDMVLIARNSGTNRRNQARNGLLHQVAIYDCRLLHLFPHLVQNCLNMSQGVALEGWHKVWQSSCHCLLTFFIISASGSSFNPMRETKHVINVSSS